MSRAPLHHCARCGKGLSRKTARQTDGVIVCAPCMFGQTKLADLGLKKGPTYFYALKTPLPPHRVVEIEVNEMRLAIQRPADPA